MGLKMGWAEVDITPEKGTKIGLAGQFFERITDEVESKITVTAFALDNGADKMVIASCDLVAVSANLHELVKEKAEKRYPELKGKYSLNKINNDCDLKIVYTPLNGTGRKPVLKVLNRIGLNNVVVVAEQEYPDGNFTTCPFPNPEYHETFEYALKYAKNIGAEIILATDPDADRVGVAIKTYSGEYT